MNSKDRTIIFTIFYLGVDYKVHAYENEFYSLMNIISDRAGVANFGLCSGMGSCGTCFVEICDKLHGNKEIVLSCGIKINAELANVEIWIQDSVY